MLTDRKRAEKLILLEMLISVIVDGASDRLNPETVAAAGLLHFAVTETIEGLPIERRMKLHRRTQRLNRQIADKHRVLGQPVAAFGLAVFCLLRAANDSDYLVVGEESAVAKALATLLPALEHAANDSAMACAEKTAAEMLEALQEYNLFSGLRVGEGSDA